MVMFIAANFSLAAEAHSQQQAPSNTSKGHHKEDKEYVQIFH